MLNKRIFIAAALLLGWSSYGQNVLTLDNALSLALEHNHDLHIARLDAEQAANSATQGNAGTPAYTNSFSGYQLQQSEFKSRICYGTDPRCRRCGVAFSECVLGR